MANSTDRTRGDQLEAELAASLYAPTDSSPRELREAAATIRMMVRTRAHRGTGGLATWFPATIQAWREGHPNDETLDELMRRFCGSRFAAAWRELSFGEIGMSMEEALYRFFVDAEVGDPKVREEEFLGAMLRGLAIAPDARFRWPSELRSAPGGFHVVSTEGVLHAAIDGQYLRGPVTPVIAAILRGEIVAASEAVAQALRTMRLIPHPGQC